MVNKKTLQSKFIKAYSDFKDYMVRDNFGLHLLTFYTIYSFIGKKDIFYGFVFSVILIILVEIIDKYLLRTYFSIKDIIAGILGLLLYLLQYYLFLHFLT